MIRNLVTVLESTSAPPQILQTVLNLAEFMEHEVSVSHSLELSCVIRDIGVVYPDEEPGIHARTDRTIRISIALTTLLADAADTPERALLRS